MRGLNRENGYALLVGALYPVWRHPVRRLRQEHGILITPGVRLRVRMQDSTMLIFGSREDAANCRMYMVWSGNPCGDEIYKCEYDIEKRQVWVKKDDGMDDLL